MRDKLNTPQTDNQSEKSPSKAQQQQIDSQPTLPLKTMKKGKEFREENQLEQHFEGIEDIKRDGEETIEKDDPNNMSQVTSKYGDKKIDLSEIMNQQHHQVPEASYVEVDPSRPRDIPYQKASNEPLPSYSNRVNIGQFSVGNYKEFQLREELAGLIEKYNKHFYKGATKPSIQLEGVISNSKDQPKGQKYKDATIINPIAVPNPSGSGEGNYSWMYLMTPYYNQLVNEFNAQLAENNVLKQHYEYFIDLQKEKETLNEEFLNMKAAEENVQQQIKQLQGENQMLEVKSQALERNVTQIQPARIHEFNDKLDNLNNVLKSKDGVIDQLIQEINQAKLEKDDLQNELLFKKQRIDTLNIEFNSKEMEYQRAWEEQQDLKKEINGETVDCHQIRRDNDMLQREIVATKNEIIGQNGIYEKLQAGISEAKGRIQDYENRLRYANDVISELETQNGQLQLDNAQGRATIDSQNKVYVQMKNTFYLANQGTDASQSVNGMNLSSSMPVIQIPKIVVPSTYYKPTFSKNHINLMPSTSKALSQQVGPSNIKSYLSSVKTTCIDLTSDIKESSAKAAYGNLGSSQRVRFDANQQQRRSDSADVQIERRRLQKDFDQIRNPTQQQLQKQQQQPQRQEKSVNRNFVDSMAGLLGMSDQQVNLLNARSQAQQTNTFPLKKVIVEDLDSKPSPYKGGYDTNMETDVSAAYYGGRITGDSSFADGRSQNNNYLGQSPNYGRAGRQGRSSQPLQFSDVKQRASSNGVNPLSFKSSPGYKQQQQQEEEKYRQATWQERMSQLPKNSAYKSSITFQEDGLTAKQPEKPLTHHVFYDQNQQLMQQSNPFSVAKDYNDNDIDPANITDPKAKEAYIKRKQQKMFELQDIRKSLQQQVDHIPENVKSVYQRNKRQQIDQEVQQLTKRISSIKYDIKKMTIPTD